MNKIIGTVLRIEKCSIHDGDGLRTVVFLKGCPLRCSWCASPESQEVEVSDGYGKIMGVHEVMAEIVKDEIFYFHSNGGLTISGGEPLLQLSFTLELLRQSKTNGINTAIETCAYGEYSAIEKLLPYLDTIYVDMKNMSNEDHILHTGASNITILENIRRIAGGFNGLRIRIPLIPGVNMDEGQIIAAARFCRTLDRLEFVEFLPYHRLGNETYRRLGRKAPVYVPPENDSVNSVKKIFSRAAPEVHLQFVGTRLNCVS
jgi:pyruvate formate lyase activating enzyme